MSLLRFVPEYISPSKETINQFIKSVGKVDKLLVMTGAGLSTESGIPDYRSEKVGQYARSEHRPVQFADFMKHEKWRQRYWARNFAAWPLFRDSIPNSSHHVLAEWEHSKKFVWLITQNVDGLHSMAGSKLITELHGCTRRVKCMQCNLLYSRESVQEWMGRDNASWLAGKVGELSPDGDVEVSEEATRSFTPPSCPSCGSGSILKTDVVFFGDCVPSNVTGLCFEKLAECDGILVLGSSLTVMSGYRFVYQALELDLPIFIVNIGPTRADSIATSKLSAKCSDIVRLLNF